MPATYGRYKSDVLGERFLLVDGVLQNQDGAISVKAARIQGSPVSGGGVARFSLMVD